MSIAGLNLHNIALGALGSQTVLYRRFAGLATMADGTLRPTWAPAEPLAGNVQAVDSTTIQMLGLDWTKNYVNFFVTGSYNEVNRDQTGDQFTYGGRTYQVVSHADWFTQYGWQRLLCVEIPNA